ncbi:hypothetical protein GOBAR_DD00849 [Gossypium barbadense]|nr:hypothetical protein GOBAR_DD00849 [Gossypium barbadense]
MGFQRNILGFLFLILASLTSLSSSLPSEYSIVEHEIDAFLSEERVLEIFQQWKEKHRKVYRHAEEAEKRFENFKGNLKYILERNAKRKANKWEHHVGLNKFADMSNEEFRKAYLSKVKKPINKGITLSRNMRRKVQSCDAPSSLDWRNYGVVTAVKDQGSCGSCWAFSSTGAMEGINALVTGDLISLSEQELVDCDTSNYGCEGGYMDYAFEWVINNGGIDSESDYPYTGVDGTCNTTKEETKVVSIDGYQDVEQSDSALLCAVAQQPVSVGIDGSAIDFQLYTGVGIYDGSCSDDPDDIDHAVLIVGYGSEGHDETCCCLFEFYDYCLIYGCCEYENAVCCTGTEYCCPSDYPICDVQEGLCLKNAGDYLGVAARKRKVAKHKLPWTKIEETEIDISASAMEKEPSCCNALKKVKNYISSLKP